MEQNFFFFTGDNDYLLSSELRTWKQTFTKKHGPENLLVVDARQQSLTTLLDAVGTMPFGAEKRLVVCDGMPKIDKDELDVLIDGVHPSTILLIVAPSADKRLGLTKALMASASAKVFDLLETPELYSWATSYAKQRGISLEPAALKALVSLVGEDQWALSQEIGKLAAYAAGRVVTPADIDVLCVPSGSQVVWKLTDLLGNRRTAEALEFYRAQIQRGEEPYGMWVILLNMVKNLIGVWACLQEGVTGERDIAQTIGIHFFSVRGLKPLAKALTSERVQWLVQWAADADIALKTGGHKYTAERPHEVISLTERLIVGCN